VLLVVLLVVQIVLILKGKYGLGKKAIGRAVAIVAVVIIVVVVLGFSTGLILLLVVVVVAFAGPVMLRLKNPDWGGGMEGHPTVLSGPRTTGPETHNETHTPLTLTHTGPLVNVGMKERNVCDGVGVGGFWSRGFGVSPPPGFRWSPQKQETHTIFMDTHFAAEMSSWCRAVPVVE
jgi:hypothetical protein